MMAGRKKLAKGEGEEGGLGPALTKS